MTVKPDYKYDIGFSFLKQDEAIAFDLKDHIQDRFSTFIYSKAQEELGGVDGEKKFNSVFYEECRVVVVLFRNGWGQTPWTRIEETSIRNRAFDKGWEFLVLINLDNISTPPKWIPNTYIWLDYERFKTEGAIAVIDQRVKASGGMVRSETIEDIAERLKRHRLKEKNRKIFLTSNEAVTTAHQELNTIFNKLKAIKPLIEDPSTQLRLGSSENGYPPMYEFGYQGYNLCFKNDPEFEYDVESGLLNIFLYERSGHEHYDYKEKIHSQISLKFDQNLIGQNGWSREQNCEDFLTSEELVDKWVKLFLEGIKKRKTR